jgi:hypothetical protein
MNRGNLLLVAGIAAGILVGWQLGSDSDRGAATLLPGPAAAWAGTPMPVEDGGTFVSTDGGNAYLWRREGSRLILLNHCARLMDETQTGQATYVSMPGVERGS